MRSFNFLLMYLFFGNRSLVGTAPILCLQKLEAEGFLLHLEQQPCLEATLLLNLPFQAHRCVAMIIWVPWGIRVVWGVGVEMVGEAARYGDRILCCTPFLLGRTEEGGPDKSWLQPFILLPDLYWHKLKHLWAPHPLVHPYCGDCREKSPKSPPKGIHNSRDQRVAAVFLPFHAPLTVQWGQLASGNHGLALKWLGRMLQDAWLQVSQSSSHGTLGLKLAFPVQTLWALGLADVEVQAANISLPWTWRLQFYLTLVHTWLM